MKTNENPRDTNQGVLATLLEVRAVVAAVARAEGLAVAVAERTGLEAAVLSELAPPVR